MQELTDPSVKTFHPLGLILLLGILVFLGLIGFGGVANIAILMGYGYDLDAMSTALTDPTGNPELKIPLLWIQGITAIGAFIIAPLFFIKTFLKREFGYFFQLPNDVLKNTVLILAIMFSFMVVNSVIIEWNQNISLPESLSWFEAEAKAKESQLEILTNFLVDFDSSWHFLLAIVVIALIPGIGEELLFRGLIQNIFFKWLRNPHVAIIISGLLFSAFHYQFYGIVPRMLLGILFGYIYFWSGKLSLAMIAHFINNAFMLTMVYFHKIGYIEYDINEDPGSPGVFTVFFFVILTAGLLFYFYKGNKNSQNGQLAEGL